MSVDTEKIESNICTLIAHARSIMVLAGELGEEAETNSHEYFKLHAIMALAEGQERLLDEIDNEVTIIRQNAD